MAAGFSVDVTSNVDERPRGLLGLDHQTRSNADTSAVFRTDIHRALRHGLLSAAGHGRRPKTVTKTHTVRSSGGRCVCVRSPSTVQDLRKTVNFSKITLKIRSLAFGRLTDLSLNYPSLKPLTLTICLTPVNGGFYTQPH